MSYWKLILFAGLSLSLLGCPTKAEETGDSEADADTDTDTDADADTDGDTDTDCAVNSGWPCSCDGTEATCGDGSACIGLQGLGDGTMGYCAPECTDSCPSTDFAADAQCAVKGKGVMYCILVCGSAADCPSDQDCVDAGGGTVCYPA